MISYKVGDVMKNIYVIINTLKSNKLAYTKKIIEWLNHQACTVFLDEEVYHNYKLEDVQMLKEHNLDTIDCAIVLGGDGTIIHSARRLSQHKIPILGINLGNLGFLAEIEEHEWLINLTKVLEHKYEIESRMMLEVKVYNGGKLIEEGYCLNDIVVSRMALSRMVGFSLFVNEEFVNYYSADGIIISTPTGSTAYNLSAGGPILAPHNEMIVMTPICPHSLTARSIVISSNDVVKITFEHNRRSWREDLMVTMDGQKGVKISSDTEIIIKKSEVKTQLIKLEGHDFYRILRRKLGSN